MSWLYTLWYGYFWPSLKGNGPEALTQTVVYGAVAVVVVPAVRHWFLKHLDHVHAKLDHIILHHPDIPNVVPGLPVEKQPKPAVSQATPLHVVPDP